MSKKTTSPESGENVKLLGHESDNLNLPPPPEENIEVSIHDSNNIKQLVNEFKGLHVQRLTCLELDTTLNKEKRQQKKVNFLWSYVNDLVEQNQVLVETVEDLQKEADDKVACRGMKLPASDPILNSLASGLRGSVGDCGGLRGISVDQNRSADLRTLFLDELVGPAANIPHSVNIKHIRLKPPSRVASLSQAKLTDQYAGLVGCCVDMQTGRHSGPCPGQCCMDKQLPEMEGGGGECRGRQCRREGKKREGVPGGAIWLLDRALLINRGVNCCGSTQAVSNITLGTRRQQTIYMFVSVSLVQITSELEDLKIQLQTKDMVICDLERTLRDNSQQKQKTLESRERLELLQRELSCLQRIHKDNMKEITERGVCITKLQAASELLRRQEGNDTRTQLSKLNERAVGQWAKKADVLKSESAVSRKQVERQQKELSGSRQKEEALLSEFPL
ncbi:Reticulocyte-binding protein 2 like a [Dissostichus eleginoides]|uniref:Reticulocyte-binding protein 2 like a n=1 Tax=Dissostichus eleginoides TaxID=100907 RepID=A0AAD9BJX3_DISEL|nr:Reticulocyte-binding protein 2 like a [Dissostichus eleginoides]